VKETGCQAAYHKHQAFPRDSHALLLTALNTYTHLAYIKELVQWADLTWPQH